MTLDEAISFQGEDSSEMKALTEDTPDCTYADVWRASFAALVFGRKMIATAVAVPKPAPAPEELTTEQVTDPAPPEGLTAKLQPLAAAPAPAATDPAADDKTPAETTVAPAAGAKLPIVLASIVPTGSAKPVAGAKRPVEQSGPEQCKRSKLDDAQCFQFIALTQAYLANDMSAGYEEAVKCAAKLSPAERAALLTALAGMMQELQEDQNKSLELLQHSIKVTDHFAKKATK